MEKKTAYPFCAIVGQEEMKRALILNMINPKLGGVLIRGEKGTAKSTAVRALADVLPERRELEGCRYSCDPDDDSFICDECRESMSNKKVVSRRMRVINLPVSATEDRVVGTIDIEHAIKFGEKRFEPGILAHANRNILYVDEINLLEDHLVDVLLDAAAMGVNSIEREGISFTHPSRFVLIGTMNPEEGDLRPQLLDRFGLVVNIEAEDDIEQRIEVVKRRLAYEEDPEAFSKLFSEEQILLGDRIEKAKMRLKNVTYSEDVLKLIAKISVSLDVDGHRADITMLKTALTNAAFRGSDRVGREDMSIAAKLSLPHRMRKRPFDESIIDLCDIEKMIEEADLNDEK
jgi:magnesium chelatase subunit I